MFADPRLVRSIKLQQYKIPRVVTSLKSTRRIIFPCSSGVNSAIRASLDSSETDLSISSRLLFFGSKAMMVDDGSPSLELGSIKK
jgi:hypothetical protein